MRRLLVVPIAALTVAALSCASASPKTDLAAARQQVLDTERAFAKTMAARDHAAFVSFLAPETIFFSGAGPLRGSQKVAEQWKRFYEGADAPFSWEPETVEVLGAAARKAADRGRPTAR